MACSQTRSGILHDCAASRGGIVEAYIANATDVASITLTSGQVTAITMDTSKKFKKYSFARNTGSLSSNWQIDDANGSKFVQSDLVLQFNRMDATKAVEIAALAQGELVIIVKDANGEYWYLGLDAPVRASAGDGLTGTARADRNGYSITLQDNSLNLPANIKVGDGGVDLSAIVG